MIFPFPSTCSLKNNHCDFVWTKQILVEILVGLQKKSGFCLKYLESYWKCFAVPSTEHDIAGAIEQTQTTIEQQSIYFRSLGSWRVKEMAKNYLCSFSLCRCYVTFSTRCHFYPNWSSFLLKNFRVKSSKVSQDIKTKCQIPTLKNRYMSF